MKKILPILSLSTVCAFGLSLNWYYYTIYFNDANYGYKLSISMAVFFILSELSLWGFSGRKNGIAVFLKYSLVAFSIFATLSSQFTSTSQKEQQNAEMVYEKTGTEEDVKYYREQIAIQDKIIQQYVSARAENAYFTKTQDEFEEAKIKKDDYEKKLELAQAVNRQQVSEVFTTKTIYAWFSNDLPELFRNGFTENLVRVLFQFFSSLLLAMMSPVAISTIRGMNPPSAPEKPVSKPHAPPDKEIKTEPKKLERKPAKKKTAFEKLSDHEVSDILKMMFWPVVQRTGEPMEPEAMVSGFQKVRETQPHVKEYSLEECKAVYDEVVRRELMESESDKIVMEELRV